MNYTELKTQIWDYLQTDDDGLGGLTDTIIRQAEERIVRAVQLPDFRKNVTGTATASNKYLSTPTDFLSSYSLSVIDGDGNQNYLLPKDVSFIRENYPSATQTGLPKYYGIFDNGTFILGPTPDSGYTFELHYYYEPASIVDTGTSWLGDNAENALLYGCLVESYVVLKGDDSLMGLYSTRFTEAMEALKILGEGRNRSDTFRNGETRIRPN